MNTRVRLGAPRAPFVSSRDRVARVTFAWLDEEGPIIEGHPFRTVVVVWPTDAQGYIDMDAVIARCTEVVRWTLSDREVEALRRLVQQGWDFGRRSDLWVTGGPNAPVFTPTARTLRDSAEHYPVVPTSELERIARGDAA